MQPIVDTTTYSVTVNSFLASGGDNFGEFKNGTGARDTGKIDLAAMVDYMAEFAAETPLAVDYSQRAVGVTFPDGAPAAYKAGDTVAFDLSSLAMQADGDVQDTTVTVKLGSTTLGTAAVDNTEAPGVTDDSSGTASVSVALPASAAAGQRSLTVVGDATGTSVKVPITVRAAAPATSRVTVNVNPKKIFAKKTQARLGIVVKAAGENAIGRVLVRVGGKTYRATLKNGKAQVLLDTFGRPGRKVAKIAYAGTSTTKPSSARLAFTVVPKRKLHR